MRPRGELRRARRAPARARRELLRDGPLPRLLMLGASVTVGGRERGSCAARAPTRGRSCAWRASTIARARRRCAATAADDRRTDAPALGEGEWWAHELEGCGCSTESGDRGNGRRLLELPSCEVLEVRATDERSSRCWCRWSKTRSAQVDIGTTARSSVDARRSSAGERAERGDRRLHAVPRVVRGCDRSATSPTRWRRARRSSRQLPRSHAAERRPGRRHAVRRRRGHGAARRRARQRAARPLRRRSGAVARAAARDRAGARRAAARRRARRRAGAPSRR